MTGASAAVFDCNTLLQAFGSPNGPARRCYDLVLARRVRLFLSSAIFSEFANVVSRPRSLRRFETTLTRVDAFLANLEATAEFCEHVPSTFDFPRDPTDEKYIDLAIATGAHLIVSRDLDLLDLMLDTDAVGQRLRTQYPSFRVLTPPAFLDLVDADDEEARTEGGHR